MTLILFWNIKWLFVRFTFCHRTTVTLLDTQWQNARTFLERIKSRYTREHDSTLSLRLSRYQGRCKLLPRNSTAALSSSGHSSEVRSMRRRSVLLKHEMIVELLTNVQKKTSLQQSFAVVTCIYLGSWTTLKTQCCHALLCIASLCVLRTCMHFAIVYRALP